MQKTKFKKQYPFRVSSYIIDMWPTNANVYLQFLACRNSITKNEQRYVQYCLNSVSKGLTDGVRPVNRDTKLTEYDIAEFKKFGKLCHEILLKPQCKGMKQLPTNEELDRMVERWDITGHVVSNFCDYYHLQRISANDEMMLYNVKLLIAALKRDYHIDTPHNGKRDKKLSNRPS